MQKFGGCESGSQCGGLSELSGFGGPSKTVGVQLAALNKPANADGDPAADGMRSSVNSWSLQCGALRGASRNTHLKE
jgi:hypothetical protein